MHEANALLELRRRRDHGGLGDPDRAVEDQRLHDQWKRKLLRSKNRLAAPEHREIRQGHSVIHENLLRQRLVAGEQESPRIAPGVRNEEHLEIGDPILIVHRDVVEVLEQVEEHVGMKALQRSIEDREVASQSHDRDHVPHESKRFDDVELHLPLDLRRRSP
jgi:hypothetical protein